MTNDFHRNIATVGDVDAGKTTLTDLLVYLSLSDKRNARGSIEEGSTLTDTGTVERNRGITIHSVPVMGEYGIGNQHYTLTIVDTPGHPEFRYQVRTALDGVEGILFLIDLNKGINLKSASLLNEVLESKIPVLAVLNKIDLVGKDRYLSRIAELERTLKHSGVKLSLLQQPFYSSDSTVWGIEDLLLGRVNASGRGNVPYLQRGLVNNLIREGEIPAVISSGKAGLGAAEILSYVFSMFREPSYGRLISSAKIGDGFNPESDFSAKILNRLPHTEHSKGSVCARVVSGTLERGSRVYNPRTDEHYRITHLYGVNGKGLERADAGDIVLLKGMERTGCVSGDTLCGPNRISFATKRSEEPIVQFELHSGQRARLFGTLRDFQKWDPSYHVAPSADGALVSASGTFLLGVLLDMLREEYKIDVSAKPFAPRYIAAPAIDSFSAQGSFSLREESYALSLLVDEKKGIMHPKDRLYSNEHGNSFSASSRELSDLAKDLESAFRGMRWFDHFPLEGFNILVADAYSMTGYSGKRTRYAALQDAVHNLLYKSGAIALFEPYLNFTIRLSDSDQKEKAKKILSIVGVGESLSRVDPDEFIFFGIHPDHLKDNSDIFHSNIPLSAYMEHEDQLLKELKDFYWRISPSDYRIVAYDRANEIIHSLVPPEENPKEDRRRERASPRRTPREYRTKAGIIVPSSSTNPITDPHYKLTEGYRAMPNGFDKSRWAGGRIL